MTLPAKGKRNDLSPIFLQLLLWTTGIWLALMGLTLSLTMSLALSSLQDKIEGDLSATAASLAESQMVQQAFDRDGCDAALMAYLDSLVENTKDLDIITIAKADSVRLYHVNHERIGETFVGGDQGRALAGESYFSDGEGTMGWQRRAFCPVLSPDGTVRGFVMASATMDRIKDLRRAIIQSYLRLAALLMLVTLAAAGGLTLLFRRVFRGVTPQRLAHTYLAQSQVLSALAEGVISTDEEGKIQFSNRAAEEMLGQSSELMEGKLLDGLIRAENGESLLKSEGTNVPTSRPNVLVSRVSDQKDRSSTLILTDRSEAMRQAEQLTGIRNVVESLRENTHEFMNKLQVISGLLQMNRQEEALAYIGSLSGVQTKLVSPILQHIQNPSVAALLLGKVNTMRDLEINLTLLVNSTLPKHSAYLSTAELVTVVGNLVENAIEAVNAQCGGGPRDIDLQITEDDGGLLILVSDTGVGIPDEDLGRICEKGFSTKAAQGRGVGMSLVWDIVSRNKGSMEVDTEPGAGTTFTLIFHQRRQRRGDAA